MFPCTYANPYTLWERLTGTTISGASLDWVERLSGWPTICTSQISIMFGLYFLTLILIISLIWLFKFRHNTGSISN